MSFVSRLLSVASLIALVSGCTSPARGFCEAHADCSRDFLGVVIPDFSGDADDSVAVCVVNQEGTLRSLRANEEEECLVAADKFEIDMACITDAFIKDDDGCSVIEDECEDELDDVNDAFRDIDGDECSSSEN